MREEIVFQGVPFGYLVKEERQAFVSRWTPEEIVEDLIEAGYAVCMDR